MPVLEAHEQNVAVSTALSRFAMATLPTPKEVVAVLNRERISFVLVGAHGLGGWMAESRATEDVDVIVSLRQVKKATTALLGAFPHLEAHDLPMVTRLHDPGLDRVVIDVMKPIQPPFRDTFHHVKRIQIEGEACRIPTLEMALVMKFAPIVSPHRANKDKLQDAHDFMAMVEANTNIDMATLHELGELIYGGGGDEITKMVHQVRAGEMLRL